MRSVWLIRHGESQSNADEVTESTDASALTETGRRQAEEVAKRFARAPDLIVVSKYVRTRQTAEPLIRRFPKMPVMEWPIHEFTYLAPDRYNGTTASQRNDAVMTFWERCVADHCDGEGAESFADFMLRIDDFLERLRRLSGQFTAVFAHGYVIKALVWRILWPVDRGADEAMKSFRDFHRDFSIGNGDILPVQLDADGRIFLSGPWSYPHRAPAPV